MVYLGYSYRHSKQRLQWKLSYCKVFSLLFLIPKRWQKQDRSGRQFQVLIPISDPNAFIICENHYKVSIVQKGLSTSQPACSSKPLNGLNTAIYDAKHDCLVSIQTSNRSWFRVRNQHRIMVHRLLRAHDGSIYFRAGSGVPIGESAHQMKYKAPVRVAIEQVEYSASLSLLIAHPDGVLERLKEWSGSESTFKIKDLGNLADKRFVLDRDSNFLLAWNHETMASMSLSYRATLVKTILWLTWLHSFGIRHYSYYPSGSERTIGGTNTLLSTLSMV